MIQILLASVLLTAVSFTCVSSAAPPGHAFPDMTLLNSHSSAVQPWSSADPVLANSTRRTAGAFALTPAETRLAIERKEALEEARDVNANARRSALELQDALTALRGEATHEGLLLRFGDASFAKGTTQLNSAARERLDQLVGFLRMHPKHSLSIKRFARDARGTDTDRRLSLGRTAAVEHYLLRSGIAENRLFITVSHARSDSIANEDEGPIIHVIIEASLIS